MRKILVGLAVLALGLMAVSPAFAFGFGSKQVTADNCAFVSTDVTAVSKTGGNKIISITSMGFNDGNNTIKTGDTYAGAVADTVVNSNLSESCCVKKQIDVHNMAFVSTDVTAVSKTGGNKIIDVAKFWGGSEGNNSITTGYAGTEAGAITVVNSNITRGFSW